MLGHQMSVPSPKVRQVSTALYRRYRPRTFAEVIGQEHVTEPLMAALKSDRVTHAYLFSGPRGCGKTTSARILARCLNCAQGPTPEPCGECDSCQELVRTGPGSLDVVEIDAASHNGVDDARDLRERAAFAPARDRFKIFILDEAHMVTTQGFNALLKLVEEPPPHVKFVFATTEPDKVIGTIRSRTHHYPFRLVPPDKLTGYLQSLADSEGVTIDDGVLPLVVRAGGGSVRDSLSVLDQLIAGADGSQVGYSRAVALLGFTHGTLLDDAVDALAARDGASLFRVVDRVVETGHAPRRFVEDLLERLRDLIVVRAAGEESASVLRSVPADQLERMQAQAQHLGAAGLSRAADLVNQGLTEMTGATSPRLQLELLCARLLLPAADDGAQGFAARLDRLEAGGVAAAPASGAAGPSVPRPTTAQAPARSEAPARSDAPVRSEAPGRSEAPARDEVPANDQAAQRPQANAERPAASDGPSQSQPPQSQPPQSQPAQSQPAASAPAQSAPSAPGSSPGGAQMTTDEVRRRWPEVLETLASLKRTSWALVSQDAQVVELSTNKLTIGFSTAGLATAFRSGPHADMVSKALRETLGLEVKVEPVLNDGSAASQGSGQGAPRPQSGGPSSGRSASGNAPSGGAGSAGSASAGSASAGAPSGGSSSWQSPSAGSAPGGTPSARQGQAPPAANDTSWPEAARAGSMAPRSASSGSASAPAPVSESAPAPAPHSASSSGGARTSADSGPSPEEPPLQEPPDDHPVDEPAPHEPPTQEPPLQEPPLQDPPPWDVEPPEQGRANSPSPSAPSPDSTSGLVPEPPREPHTPAPVRRYGDEMDEHSADDPDLETTDVIGAPLVARLLGGTVIEEQVEDGTEPR